LVRFSDGRHAVSNHHGLERRQITLGYGAPFRQLAGEFAMQVFIDLPLRLSKTKARAAADR
jgi:hypothetical protein